MIDRAFYKDKTTFSYEDLLRIVRDLRDPEEGCPWDRVQTHESITECMIEESYEVVNAINQHDADNLREELGDVLLQVIFHSQLSEDAGGFTMDDVIQELCEKLIRRHPHVFAETKADSPEAALLSWNETKAKEKKNGLEAEKNELERVPQALPALIRAQKVLKKAEEHGYDPDLKNASEKEMRESLEALILAASGDSEDEKAQKCGVFLLQTVNFLRKMGVNSEKILTSATEKYITRITDCDSCELQ